MLESQKQQIEVLRAQVAADGRSQEIARNLNMSLNDYAGLVAHFKVTGEEPQFLVVPDEVLRKHGHRPPTLQRLKAFILGEKKVVELSGRTSSFADTPRIQVHLK